MKGKICEFLATSVATILAMSSSVVAQADATCGLEQRQLQIGIQLLEAKIGAPVVAVGRVDSISSNRGVAVLGFVARPSADDQVEVGDYVAVLDWSAHTGKRSLEVRPLPFRYVPGVSHVFLKATAKANDPSLAIARVGSVLVDYSRQILEVGSANVERGAIVSVSGVQPNPGGVILGSCISVLNGSMGTGRVDGSMGTGRTDGSMGTGKLNGSMGTGRVDGSMGTGRTDGSMGTGRVDGSMGTGRTDGSMGTGKLNGSMGTGRVDGSMGTGRTD